MLVMVTEFPSMVALLMVTDAAPVFCMVIVATPLPPLLVKTVLVIDACSELPMNPMVKAPIHAATTTLTATVTAMSMMVAITGLSALAFFLNFLKFNFYFYPPLGY